VQYTTDIVGNFALEYSPCEKVAVGFMQQCPQCHRSQRSTGKLPVAGAKTRKRLIAWHISMSAAPTPQTPVKTSCVEMGEVVVS
jgi:hypothetical protein